MAILIRIILVAIPVLIIYVLVREYLKQKAFIDEDWETQWEQKKKNVRLEEELKEKEREITKLKDKLGQQDQGKPHKDNQR